MSPSNTKLAVTDHDDAFEGRTLYNANPNCSQLRASISTTVVNGPAVLPDAHQPAIRCLEASLQLRGGGLGDTPDAYGPIEFRVDLRVGEPRAMHK